MKLKTSRKAIPPPTKRSKTRNAENERERNRGRGITSKEKTKRTNIVWVNNCFHLLFCLLLLFTFIFIFICESTYDVYKNVLLLTPTLPSTPRIWSTNCVYCWNIFFLSEEDYKNDKNTMMCFSYIFSFIESNQRRDLYTTYTNNNFIYIKVIYVR